MANSIFRTSQIKDKTPRTTNRFNLRFSDLNTVLANARNQSIEGETVNRFNAFLGAAGASETVMKQNLELSLASVTIPSVELEAVDVYRFNDSVKHITRFSPMQDMSVAFYDYIDGSASAIMQIWHGLIGDKKSGAINFKSQYVCGTAHLFDYGPKAPGENSGEEVYYAKYEIRNLYPRTIELGDFSYESAEVRKVTVQFACDGVFPVEYRGSV